MKKNKKESKAEDELQEDLQDLRETLQEDEAEQEKEEEGPQIEIIDTPESKLQAMTDKYHRSLAEFDNFRKRTTKEMAARYDDGVRGTAEKLLPLIDNFERALNAHPDKEDSFYQGVAMIARQFDDTLHSMGVEVIAAMPGDDFDTNYHNAVAHGEDENFGPNQISDVLQKGYIHKDKVIRYSMVKVVN